MDQGLVALQAGPTPAPTGNRRVMSPKRIWVGLLWEQ